MPAGGAELFHLDGSWVWDLWFADDGKRFHMFFLHAPSDLATPDERHFRARIGHATSADLRDWERGPDALGPSATPAFDDLATWTGSVVKGDDNLWYLFYTGASKAESGLVQRIGLATSEDLFAWERAGEVLVADPRWYETLDPAVWPDQACRDPWVFHQESCWHMLFTARANHGPPDDRGVVGHATSDDLRHWVVRAPLSLPGQGFGQLEVPQVETIEGHSMLFFSCLGKELAASREGSPGGVWAATGRSPLGDWDIGQAQQLTDESLYAGRAIKDRSGAWFMLAFRNAGADGGFVGEISDPLPLSVGADGRLHLTTAAPAP